MKSSIKHFKFIFDTFSCFSHVVSPSETWTLSTSFHPRNCASLYLCKIARRLISTMHTCIERCMAWSPWLFHQKWLKSSCYDTFMTLFKEFDAFFLLLFVFKYTVQCRVWRTASTSSRLDSWQSENLLFFTW